MSSNAQRDLYEDFNEMLLAATGTDGGGPALRRIAAERLAAHRNRRASSTTAAPDLTRSSPRISENAQRVRDAVAARYRQTPSYQDVLATPSAPEPTPQRSVEAKPQQPTKQTWIDEPLIPVEPVAQTQSVFEQPFTEPVTTPAPTLDDFFTDDTTPASFDPAPVSPAFETSGSGYGSFQNFEVRPYGDLPSPTWLPERNQQTVAPAHPDELQSLDEEIAFRLAPEFDQHFIEPLPIQANIIEFPRQLVATRKQRPRLAEGPLRSDVPAEYGQTTAIEPSLFDSAPSESVPAASDYQMRIFEVDPRDSDWSTPGPSEPVAEPAVSAVSSSPVTEQQPPAPAWQHMVLDAAPDQDAARDYLRTRRAEATPQTQAEPELSAPPVARFELRLMASLVDAACIGMAFVVFATVTALTTQRALEGVSHPLLFAAALVLLLVLTVLYQGMFFTLGASTPGMYYAHLEFRTLAGRLPSRGLMRRRITANLIAAAPLGLGLLTSMIDGRSLGWNDRLSGLFLQEL